MTSIARAILRVATLAAAGTCARAASKSTCAEDLRVPGAKRLADSGIDVEMAGNVAYSYVSR